MSKKKLIVTNLLLLAALAIVPFVLTSFYLIILTEVLILGLFALSLNILLGYTGLVSLGHAAFFGLGAYTAGLVAKNLSSNIFVTVTLAIVVSALVAAILGYFCTKAAGFYFLMITLAFSQMIYSFFFSWRYAGASNGLSGIPKPTLFGDLAVTNQIPLYFLILAIFIFCFLVIRRFVFSPIGKVLVGIKENETRMKAMGYNTMYYKNLAYIVAGAIGGVAGCLYTYFNGFVGPGDMYWTMSGKVMIMVLIGGAGTLMGPILGAAFIVILETVISSYTEMWMMIVGAVFILFVVFAPKGIVGIYSSLVSKLSRKDHVTPVVEEKAKA